MPAPTAPRAVGPARSRNATLIITAAGTFLALAAYTLPLTDLATLSSALAAGAAARTWILSSMSVGLTAAMLLAGTLADRYGRRRMFVLGAAVLLLGTVVDLAAGIVNVDLRSVTFIVGRVITGIGAAAVVAAALALLAEAFPRPAERATAGSTWAVALGAGIAAGPFGAALANRAGQWWLSYLGLAVLSAALLVVGGRGLAESRSADRRRLDLAGAVMFLLAAVTILIGLVDLRTSADRREPVIMIAVAVLLFVAFVMIEFRRRDPMLDPRYFRDRDFAAVQVAAFAVGLGSIGLMSVSGVFMIADFHLGVLATSIVFTCWSLASTVTAYFARRLPGWLRGRRQLGVALLIIAVGQLTLIRAESVAAMLPGFLIAGIAAGVVNSALGRETAGTAPEGRTGLGSGINNTARYLGSAIGVTLCASLLLHGGMDRRQLESGWTYAVALATALLAAGGVAVLILNRSSVRR
ncbi:MFS transporter [Microlunatus elymi]|nr:MFS transporter [Microlunatus elymi]